MSRRAFDVCIVVYACSVFYAQIVLVPLDKAITKAVKGLPAVEDDGKDAVQSIFMPFPLTTKKIRPPPYSGRDPEWQAFIKLSKDKEANTSMRSALYRTPLRRVCPGCRADCSGARLEDLAEIVRNEVGRSQLAQRLGSPIKVRRWWLDAEYPFGPPPEYRRSG